jgi:hypothetical protein
MTRAARIEGRVQVGILLLMGAMAGAASFTHIHDLAVAHKQPSWIGWADAVVVELMSIVAGLESRRRTRADQSTRFVHLVLYIAVLTSLAAQVAKAELSVWGWIVAALPAVGFLAVVKIVMSRQPVETGPVRSGTDDPGQVQVADRTLNLDTRILEGVRANALPTGRAEQLDRSSAVAGPDRTEGEENVGPVDAADRSTDLYMRPPEVTPGEQVDPSLAGPTRAKAAGRPDQREDGDADRSTENQENQVVPVQRINGHHARSSDTGRTDDEHLRRQSSPPGTRTGPDDDRSGADMAGLDRSGPDDDLLQEGKTIAAKLAMRNIKLTRQALIDAIRGTGGTISTDRASDLLRWLKEDETASVGTS